MGMCSQSDLREYVLCGLHKKCLVILQNMISLLTQNVFETKIQSTFLNYVEWV